MWTEGLPEALLSKLSLSSPGILCLVTTTAGRDHMELTCYIYVSGCTNKQGEGVEGVEAQAARTGRLPPPTWTKKIVGLVDGKRM